MERKNKEWEALQEMPVGASLVKDDIWDMAPLIPSKVVKDGHKKIRFAYIRNPQMKRLVKQYAYYKLSSVKPITLVGVVNGSLPFFIRYLEANGISDFREFDRELYLGFVKYLKEEAGLSDNTGMAVTCTVEEVIRIGQIRGWDVPEGFLFQGLDPVVLWGKNRTKEKVRPIPDDVFGQILSHALHDEKDTLTKAGIIIQSQTGLRIGEVLCIQEGCLGRTREGVDFLETCIRKTEKGEPVRHRVFINELVKDAVCELSEKTRKLREESGLKELFLIRTKGQVSVCKVEKWSARRLRSFIRRHDIRDSSGELYHLRSHQFRATFVRELVKRKIPIAMIMKQYAHVSVEMTSYYLTLQESEVRDIYAEMVLSPESGIAGLRAGEIRKTLSAVYRGKTADEIGDIVSDLARTMSFNPLPTGVCLYDFRRGNCTDGDGCFFYNCPNFITEVQFYPVLKKELEMLELEMNRLKELGHTREWQKQYVKHKYLKPLVEGLEVEIREKENAV